MWPVQSVHHKITEYAFVGLALIVPPMSIAANRAIVPVCAIAALMVLFGTGPRQLWHKMIGINRVLLLGAVVFLGVLAVSTFWALDPGRGWVTVGKVLGTFLMAAILVLAAGTIPAETARRVTYAILISILSVTVFLIVDVLSDGFFSLTLFNQGAQQYYGYYWFKSSAALLALGIWPILLFLWRTGKAWLGGLLLIALSGLAYELGANSVTAALLGGVAFGWVFTLLGRQRFWLTFIAISVVIIFQPLIIKQFVSPAAVSAELPRGESIAGSTVYRLYIWDFVSDRIQEKPILGWGVGASRKIGEGELAIDPTRGEIGEAVPLHPHNAFLQLHLEMGIAGLLLTLVPIGVVLWRLTLPIVTVAERMTGFGLLFATMFQYSVSFSVWSSWWNASVLFSIAMMVAVWRNRGSSSVAR